MKSKRISLAVGLVVLAVLPFATRSEYTLHLCLMALIYTIMAQAMNLVFGYTDNLSLGQAGIYSVGAYAVGILSVNYGWGFWSSMLAGIVVGGVLGLLIALVSLRHRGSAFIIMTTTFASIVRLLEMNMDSFTNGQKGIAGIPHPQIFGFAIDTKISYYYFVLLCIIVLQILMVMLIDSKFGRAFMAVKQDETLAMSLGINPYKFSILTFTIGSVLTSFAGCLYAGYAQFISPELSSFSGVMLTILMMCVLGGKGTLWGPCIGAFVCTLLPELLRVADDLRLPIYGLILILTVLFLPGGFVSVFTTLKEKLFRGRKEAAEK